MRNKTIISIVALSGVVLVGVTLSNMGNEPLPDQSPHMQEHLNVLFVPDLSRRIEELKPVKDVDILNKLYASIEPKFIHADGKQAFQLDHYCLALTNEKLVVDYKFSDHSSTIDLAQFGIKQKDRIDYLKDRSEESLSADISKMNDATNHVYESALKRTGNAGTDIWSFFNELDASDIKKPGSIPSMMKGVEREYRNIVFLLTDGYLELGNGKDINKKGSRSLTQNMVKAFRKDYQSNKNGRTLEGFFKDEGYGIKRLSNELLKHTEIVVLELNDRSADDAGNTPEISDRIILKLFWNDWFEKSGVKSWRLESSVPSLEKLDNIIDEVILKKY